MEIQKLPNLIFGILILNIVLICGCNSTDPEILDKGVSSKLAKLRDNQLKNLKYHISFQIPDSVSNQITGHETIEFDFTKDFNPLILDFRNPESNVKSVKIDGKFIKYKFENEHIIIANSKLKNGKNKIEIEFIASDRALNRNEEYLYTLFVPDRACTAFPCFDQPSLKAKFKLDISVPNNWIAIANSLLLNQKTINNRETYFFEETERISTYLFSFVVGKFSSVTKTFNNREITMYHRIDDDEKLNKHIDEIFELQYSSLEWLETYTQIDYPFKKFDFIIIPSFQYSGMEHPGAILYRESRLFLDNNSTTRDKLNRANLIAHETAHIWFGDFVTMQWFSEVWLKEVFANFIAGKIVNPQYPELNHDLNFIISHYPSSYSVDRTKGVNPIEQELNNLKNAGSLYGNIIYHKAPIVMKKLEEITGEKILQKGLQEYLNKNKYGNADWNELISILNSTINFDLEEWSQSWVFESGMPSYFTHKSYNEKDMLQSIIIEQTDPNNKGRQWSQEIEVFVKETSKNNKYQIELKDTFNVIELDINSIPIYIFPNSQGLGYGYFKLDSLSIGIITNQLKTIIDPVLRCSMYISLWENMLNQNIKPLNLFDAYVESLKTEVNSQNINLTLGYLKSIYWQFLSQEERDLLAPNFEEFIWKNIQTAISLSIKSSFFDIYKKIVLTPEGVGKLYKIWNKDIEISGLNFSINDFTEIAFELALRDLHNTEYILTKQFNRIKNTERKKRFKFIKPSLSKSNIERDSFFENLKNEKNREKELWVKDALIYLHHPLRNTESVKYIKPSLEILEELQVTGDIFFPKQWLDATFSGHSSIEAVLAINLFLNENPNLPENLKNKILQSTDLVFRSNIIKKE